VFIEAKDDGGGGDNWSYKPCKAPVKSSPANQHPVFLQAGCPSCCPTSVKALKGNVKQIAHVMCALFILIPVHVTLSLICFNGHFPGGPGLAGSRMSPFWILLELRMMEVVSGDNWSYNMCKATVKSSLPPN